MNQTKHGLSNHVRLIAKSAVVACVLALLHPPMIPNHVALNIDRCYLARRARPRSLHRADHPKQFIPTRAWLQEFRSCAQVRMRAWRYTYARSHTHTNTRAHHAHAHTMYTRTNAHQHMHTRFNVLRHHDRCSRKVRVRADSPPNPVEVLSQPNMI